MGREYLNPEYQAVFDRYFALALQDTADARQAKHIATERTRAAALDASAAVAMVQIPDGATWRYPALPSSLTTKAKPGALWGTRSWDRCPA